MTESTLSNFDSVEVWESRVSFYLVIKNQGHRGIIQKLLRLLFLRNSGLRISVVLATAWRKRIFLRSPDCCSCISIANLPVRLDQLMSSRKEHSTERFLSFLTFQIQTLFLVFPPDLSAIRLPVRRGLHKDLWEEENFVGDWCVAIYIWKLGANIVMSQNRTTCVRKWAAPASSRALGVWVLQPCPHTQQ